MESAKMLVGEGEQLVCEAIFSQDDPEEFKQRVTDAVKSVDTGEGVAVFVDLFGGTPFNTIAKLCQEMPIRVVSGINIPMMIYIMLERTAQMPLQEVVSGAMRAGYEGIVEYGLKS